MQLIRSRLRGRCDEGSVVIVAILLVALLVISLMAVTTVVNGMGVATIATEGEQAVAQANAGVSDALFRLDQMGQSVTSFCEGTPPTGVRLPAGVASWIPPGVSACSPAASPPLASAPDLSFSAVTVQSNQQAHVVAVASVAGQTRTVSSDLYQIVDDFGIYGVASVLFHGNGNASIEEVDSRGNVVTSTLTHIDIGIGASGVLSCDGGVGTGVIVIPGPGASESGSCPAPKGVIAVTPQDPQVCASGQSTQDAFTPCIGAPSYALDSNGNPYCPLPGVTIAGGAGSADPTGLAAGVDPPSDAPSAPPEGAASIYDCDTAGGPLVVASTGSSQPIPAGSYYVTSESTQIENIDPGAFGSGPVSLYVLPADCYGGGNPIAGAASYGSDGCAAGSAVQNDVSGVNPNCAASPPSPVQSLSLLSASGSGALINETSSGQNGNPANFNLFWAGCGSIPISSGSHTTQFVGNLYAPGGDVTANSHFTLEGSIIVGVLSSNGDPTITYEYSEHQAKVLQGWTRLNYQITP